MMLLMLFLTLDAVELKSVYYVNSNSIYLSDITKSTKDNKPIYHIDKNKHTKKIKTKELLNTLKKNGYKEFKTKSRYVKFIKKSPINLSKIKKFLKDYYINKYKNIDIQDIRIQPRSYIPSLPKEYKIHIRDKNYLCKSGILNIKTPKNKKIFFNYTIKATIPVYITKQKIKKSEEISLLNTAKHSIILDKFRASPIQSIDAVVFEAKRNLKKETILTTRDTQILSLVKRGSFVNVFIHSQNLSISFSAKALDSGKLGDTIRVQKSDKKRLKVMVVGKHKAEVR